MPRLSKREHENRLEKIRTAMLREFTDSEIMTAEGISRGTLTRYKKTIRERGLKYYSDAQKKEARAIFIKQLQRWEDIIRQASRILMIAESSQKTKVGLLRVINDTTRNIVEYMMRSGLIAEAPKTLNLKTEIDVNILNQTMQVFVDAFEKEKPELVAAFRNTVALLVEKENDEAAT